MSEKTEEKKQLINSVESKYIEQVKYYEDDVKAARKTHKSLDSLIKSLAKVYDSSYSDESMEERGLEDDQIEVIRECINLTLNYLINTLSEFEKDIYRTEGRMNQIQSSIKTLHIAHDELIKKEERSEVTKDKVVTAKKEMDKRRRGRPKKNKESDKK